MIIQLAVVMPLELRVQLAIQPVNVLVILDTQD